MKYSQTLTNARIRAGLTQEQVANQAGISRTQYVSMEGGAIPTPDRWRRVIAALGVSEESYLSGMTKAERDKALDEKRRGRRTPKLGKVGFLKNPEAGISKVVPLTNMPDDSMEPAFMKGDAVNVETIAPVVAGDIVAIKNPDGSILVRRLVRIDEVRNDAVVEDIKTRTIVRVPLIDHEFDDSSDLISVGTTIYKVV